MRTFRDGSNWANSAWSIASSGAPADATTWVFEEATGLLLSKTYADNMHVEYTYSGNGKLATRTWARLSAATVDYDLQLRSTDRRTNGIDYSTARPTLRSSTIDKA